MPAAQKPRQQGLWTLELFGRGRLRSGAAVVQLERKTAALFAFLALEGATSRSTLAGLLWADSTEESARNSLRQRLYRLRVSVGQDLIVSSDPLRLEPSLIVDALRFESLIFTNDFQAALAFEGEFLANVDFDDCPELFEWVLAARERLEAGRREAGVSEANRLERSGDYAAALGRARQLLLRDPISEDAHRRLMRLHYLANDRPAALLAFRQCQSVLRSQLGVEPLPETQYLASLIVQGQTLPQSQPLARFSIPLQILRPPVLVGRGLDWAQLEAAWEAGLGAVVHGQAGVGKTRLVSDFLTSKTSYLSLEGRPGDAGIGYASFTRGLKRILEHHRDLSLEPWAQRELSRIVPSFDAEPPPAMQSDSEKIRFFSSVLELLKTLASRGIQAIFADDLQFMDAASFELWLYILSSELQMFTCSAYRSGELEVEAESHLLQTKHRLIEVLPLEIGGLGELLTQLELPEISNLAESLRQYTGGNPMYVLETLKSLLETGGIARGLPQHFPPPQKIGALIRHRLERLSSVALRLARVAAVAEIDFSLSLATNILEMNALELSDPVQELENAQVLIGERFAHDLIFEATLEGVPKSIQQLVHQKTAVYLENNTANPASIARHYLKAAQENKAIPFLLDSAQLSVTNFQLREATASFERAATALENQGQRSQAFRALSEARKLLAKAEVSEHLEEMIHKLSSLATTPTEKALVALARAEMYYQKGDMPSAQRAAREGCKLSFEHNKKLYFELLAYVAGALAEQNKLNKASELFEQCLAFFLEQNDQPMVQHALGNVAYIYGMQGRRIDATRKLEQQFEIALKLNDLEQQVAALNGLMFNYYMLGMLQDGLQKGDQALEIYNRLDGQDYERCRTLTHIGNCARGLSNYTRALTCIQQATELSQQTNLPNA